MTHYPSTTVKNNRKKAGFSLIELLVSIGLFSVVITMSVGTMVVLLDANAKAQNMNILMTNLSFSLNSISREIRTGFGYYCDTNWASYKVGGSTAGIPPATGVQDCSAGSRLSVVETDNSLTRVSGSTYGPDNRITYYFAQDYYGPDHGAIVRRLGTGTALPLTSEEIDVDTLSFTVVGSAVGTDTEAPRVRVFVSGKAGDIEDLDTTFRIQTTVTQRMLDI